MQRFNDWLALKITNVVSTMWCAYAFAVLAFLSLPASIKSGQLLVIIAWIAQTFLQLVLLSVIMVGQKLQNEQMAQNHAQHMRHIDKVHKKLGIT